MLPAIWAVGATCTVLEAASPPSTLLQVLVTGRQGLGRRNSEILLTNNLSSKL